jgi:hypothetical protein
MKIQAMSEPDTYVDGRTFQGALRHDGMTCGDTLLDHTLPVRLYVDGSGAGALLKLTAVGYRTSDGAEVVLPATPGNKEAFDAVAMELRASVVPGLSTRGDELYVPAGVLGVVN